MPIKRALPGGAAHGAFTGGVLDWLLQLPGVEIESIPAETYGYHGFAGNPVLGTLTRHH